jgi:crotonobetainyl-CoA:carnitine CoA-transferase CaiB-like acyl-CoA transferase
VGQAGPRARQPGHDINYLGLTGALRSIARLGHAPVPPLNLVADYGGGGMMLAFGIVTALVERSTSGRGQVVDAAMVDGVSLLMTGVWSRAAQGRWPGEPGANDLDRGAPFYDVYATCDGEYMAVGDDRSVFRIGLARPPITASRPIDLVPGQVTDRLLMSSQQRQQQRGLSDDLADLSLRSDQFRNSQ